MLIFLVFAIIYLCAFIYICKINDNMLCNILFLISDIVFLYFTLFLYEYPGFLRIIAYFWILICIIINVIFFIRCIIKRQFIYMGIYLTQEMAL
jgi:hypothetical protein